MKLSCSLFHEQIRREWRWIAFRGVLAILLGIMAFLWPLASIWALALLWGAFAFTDGIFTSITAWHLHKQGARWWP